MLGYRQLAFPRCGRLLAVLALLVTGQARAAEPPAHLPKYDLDLNIDVAAHRATLHQRVTWTNHTKAPLNSLAFNFYPNYQVPRRDYLALAKTLEMLRLQPSIGIDRGGRAGVITAAKLTALGKKKHDQTLNYEYDDTNPTTFRFPLPAALEPGETVVVELTCEFYLPNKQGRLGYWKDVTFLTNAFPVLAFCDDTGWRPMPFIPWHQPFFNEAGVWRATVTLPEGEVLATSPRIKSEAKLDGGRKRVELDPFVGRDFPVLCSTRYREYSTDINLPDGTPVNLRCIAFEEHEWYAREILKIVGEAIPVYSTWFGNFPYASFTVAEAYFGWNGNECAGLVMIDERVFGMPHLARGYVEYLVSHETSHQWWYNYVGTNGYAEPFMDEASAAFFTHKLLDKKNGKNNAMLAWPQGLQWLPNINRENYRFGGTYYTIRNQEMNPAAQDLPKYGHLFNLFAGAYDRGSMAIGMIENQMGEAAFLDFTRGVVAKYGWRVLQLADYKRELEAYTGRDWTDFFDRWIYGKGLTDWKVEGVTVSPRSGPRVRNLAAVGTGRETVTASAVVVQKGEFTEPTTIGFTLKGGEIVRVPVGGDKPLSLPEIGATVTPIGDKKWRVDVELAGEPEQVAADPDHVILDANPHDNRWKPPVRAKVTPLLTSLDDADLTSDYDRVNLIAGPWAWGASYQDPWYTRSTMIGLRAGANKPQHWKADAYAAYRTDYRDIIFGASATKLGDHYELGLNYERRIAGPFGNQDGSGGPQRAVAYYRDVMKPGSSLYLPPLMYQDLFATYQDNFLPFPRSTQGERFQKLSMAGYHYRLNLYTPYWNPECGVWVDAMAAAGGAEFTTWKGMGQGRLELAAVHGLPDCLGPLQHVRVAGRVVTLGAWPDYGQFYALGGGTLFRGFDFAERQGNALWVANAELRIPVKRDVTWDVLDHTIGARSIWLAAFTDIGTVYADGRSVGGVAYALGAGLRVEVAVFSFIERATLRFDVAKTINAASPWQWWFGIQHAF
ncbi:M1 family aminopeptidase [Gemmata sp.]|uniref:M1 family aminopeptidase n=1 Tax=Gemmata sp. TaxID=1914242 RepID=UPI003F6F0B0C